MKCILKTDRELSEWEYRKIREDFENLFMAYDLEYLFMTGDGGIHISKEERGERKQKRKESIKRYRQSKEGKMIRKRYRQSEEGKIVRKKSMKKYRQSEKGKIAIKKSQSKYSKTEKGKEANKKFRNEHPERVKELQKKYYQSEKGKQSRNRAMKKYFQTEKGKIVMKKAHLNYVNTERGKLKIYEVVAKRRHNLKWIPLMNNPFPEEIEVQYHHINDIFVIPLPKEIHLNNLGSEHREKCNIQIKELFGLDVNRILYT